MSKVSPHIDLGTGYVQISKLPFDQAIKIREFVPQSSILSFNTSEGFIADALEYSQYEYWFDFHHESYEADFSI
ncbi:MULTISPECIES: hypothetical protein [Roseivirga]|jgi:hypothetical protein|uniref:hypothetical protein n=1 Tax=Roseivirga TaxID=290180 RepID=UPI000D7B601E|nr:MULTISPECIES: hypothetical protein [Roseivirga]PWL29983.1 MAG: hypothetical protein DCO95_09110 [Roseivirga sp. XM-24bin3]MBO6495438.1 hypothetical protein [Roseivirga sp.]MBO6661590.1 hypothetical protein [Roseivirga sp.]MBO6908426.1 hypothetical protein [Roseivirga sp.]WPZ11324.1 hypothetical protein T7867_04305 [Roseivirga spongicola]|tara:strand:- start:39 stop:260 length:222 start_codon:yes stop_codon:yes gene_type:complete